MISEIILKDVRKFKNKKIVINSNRVILSGKNAVGKTTVLEAISLTSITKSHRTNNLKEIITEGSPFLDVTIKYDNKKYRIVVSNEGKMVSINNNEIKKLSDYIGEFIHVFFCPNDLEIITSSPTLRRGFLNQEISQINSMYLNNLNIYNKLLSERNLMLKELTLESDTVLLDVITSRLVEVGKKIIIERMKFIDEINNFVNEIHSKINSNEFIKLVYQPSTPLDKIEEIFKSKKNQDILSHQTNYGIQRDELIFLLNDKNVSKFASQGQIRNVILSVKLALCKVIYKYKGKHPVLLLDDVLSELDLTRQNALLQLLDEYPNIQTIITTVDVNHLNLDTLKRFQIINL